MIANTFYRFASAYARMGWPVFPVHSVEGGKCFRCRFGSKCSRPGKHPLVPRGLHEATVDLWMIAKWARRWPTANIGMATGASSGVDVLDVDGPAGLAQLDVLQSLHGQLPTTPMAITGGSGVHYFFRRNPERPFRSRVKVAPGVDTRGAGGFIILPPSSHISGRVYRWVRPPHEVELAMAPTWLLDLVTKKKAIQLYKLSTVTVSSSAWRESYVRSAIEGEIQRMKSAVVGARNHTLFKCAASLGGLAAGGAPFVDAALEELREAAKATGLEPHEIEGTLASGWARGTQEPRVQPPLRERAR